MGIRRLPDSAYNWTSFLGAMIALAALSIIILFLTDHFVQETTIYLGLVIYIALPGVLITGLLMIALGIFVERRRRARGGASSFAGVLHLDLRNRVHRNAILIFSCGTALFLMASTVGTYKAYKHTESVEFCGSTCHSVMKPEYTAYQNSPHARVSCVACHIGEGAGWYVQSKLSGAYQVYATLADQYPRPIPTPIEHLRPARETCEQCHWPEQFFGARLDVNQHFLGDEDNTPYPITMLVNVGGGGAQPGEASGIHWHVAADNKVEYAARDAKRLDIAWVRFEDGEGNVREYHHVDDPMSAEALAAARTRTMDCMDCHNRPSHVYRSPARLINEALATGAIDRTLPSIKMQAVTVLDREYRDTPAALAAIDSAVVALYEEDYPEVLDERPGQVAAAIAEIQRLYQQNFFPEMKVSWRQYPDHIGHSEFVGCFRCHGEALETDEGETITADCNVCHTILAQGTGPGSERIAPAGLAFVHPEDIDGEEFEMLCTECHEGGAENY